VSAGWGSVSHRRSARTICRSAVRAVSDAAARGHGSGSVREDPPPRRWSMAVAWARLSSHGVAAPPPLHEACRRQSKGRRTCESLIAQRAGQGKQKVGQTRAEGAWDSDVSPRPPLRDRLRWLRVGATPPTDSCLEQPGIMPFLPPVIVDGHAYCREPSRPACTPHEFRILVGFSHEIRNQFFKHMNAGKLPKNQEGFSAAQTVRENGRFSGLLSSL
jgi:hypothetical protein